MVADVVYRRTGKGEAEVTGKGSELSPKLRTALFFVDGNKTAARLVDIAGTLGLKADFLETLEQKGLIEAVGVAASKPVVAEEEAWAYDMSDPLVRYRVVHQFMNDTAVDALGLVKGFFFTLKMEKCGSLPELMALAETHRQLIAKAKGEAQANLVHKRLQELASTASG
jgi:hypothetical protein